MLFEELPGACSCVSRTTPAGRGFQKFTMPYPLGKDIYEVDSSPRAVKVTFECGFGAKEELVRKTLERMATQTGRVEQGTNFPPQTQNKRKISAGELLPLSLFVFSSCLRARVRPPAVIIATLLLAMGSLSQEYI